MTLRRTMRAMATIVTLCLTSIALADDAGALQSSEIEPKAADMVSQFAEHLAAARSTAVQVTSTLTIFSDGRTQSLASHFEISAERPDKLAIRHTEGLYGSTIVSDGQTLAVFQPNNNEFTTAPAPATIQAISDVPVVRQGTKFNMLLSSPGLFGDAPYDNIMDGVTTSSYIGTENVNGVQCHRLHFEQNQFHWDAWFAMATPPILVKAEIQQNRPRNTSLQPVAQDVISTLTMEFADWQFNHNIPSAAFDVSSVTGAAAPSATGSAQTGAAITSTTPITSRLGQPAPDFQLPLLNGKDIEKVNSVGKVVVLDFWATWCGPCRRLAPIFQSLEKQFRNEPVEFISVNIREDSATIETFLSNNKLELNVALDSDGSTAKAFGVRALPTIVVLGTDGKISHVHEGVSSDFKDAITSQLQSLLRDTPAIATEPVIGELQFADTVSTAVPVYPELTRLWRTLGQWEGVAYDSRRNVIIATSRRGLCAEFGLNGKLLRDFAIDSVGTSIRLSQLDQTDAYELVTFTSWLTDLRATTIDGDHLWNFPEEIGINDVATYDLTGDGHDEVIVGFNGFTGVYALSPDGTTLWKNEELGNVWHCSAGKLFANREPKVVSTSSLGRIHILSAGGKLEDNIQPGFYAYMVRLASTTSGNLILASGSRTGMVLLAAFTSDKTKAWELLLQVGEGSVESMTVSECGTYVAAALRSGDVFIVDTLEGSIKAMVEKQSHSPQCTWAVNPIDKSPMLVISTGHSISAYQL